MTQATSPFFNKVNRFLPISMRYGQFRYYWLALLAGVTGHQMLLNFTMGWLMFDLTGDERDLAFLGIAIAVPALGLNLLGGVLADRFEPKYLVSAAQATSATVVVLLAILVSTGRVEVWHLLVAAVLIGAVQAFDQPSRSSVFPRFQRGIRLLRRRVVGATLSILPRTRAALRRFRLERRARRESEIARE